jgi:hypothetical protein
MIYTQPPLDVRGIRRIAAAAASTAGCWEGGEGWPHASLAVVAMDGDGNCNGDCLSKKGVGQGKRRGGIERWVCFFHAVLFCYHFLAYRFQCRLIDFCHCRCVLLLPLW